MRILLLVVLLASSSAVAAPVQMVACVGDSLAQGFPAPNTPWCQQLQQRRTGQKFMAVNLAFSGETCLQVDARLNTWVFDSTGKPRGYTRLVLLCGTNDLAAGTAAATVYSRITSIITKARNAGLLVTVLTVPPRKNGAAYSTDLQTRLDALNTSIRGTTTVGVTIVDISGTAGVADPADPLQILPAYGASPNDWLHFGPAGNVRIADRIDATAGALP